MSSLQNFTLSRIAARYTTRKVYRVLLGLFYTIAAIGIATFLANKAGLVTYGWVALCGALMMCYVACIVTGIIVLEANKEPHVSATKIVKSRFGRTLFGVFYALAAAWLITVGLFKIGLVPEFWTIVSAIIMLLYALCVAAAFFGKGIELLMKRTNPNKTTG